MNDTSAAPTGPIGAFGSEARRRLARGSWAALALAGLSAAGSGFEFARGEAPGLTAARILGWAALIPGPWVVGAYRAAGRESGMGSLGRGAACSFGAIVLAGIYDLATAGILPPAARAGAWGLFGLGLVVLPALAFSTEPGRMALAAAGGLFAASRALAAAGPFAPGLLGGLGAEGVDLAEGVGAFAVVSVVLPSVLFFAGAKIRAGRRLGGAVAAVGWAELAGLLLLLAWAAVAIVSSAVVASAAPEGGAGARFEEVLDGQLNRGLTAAELVGNLAWGGLTAWAFATLRARRDPTPGPGAGRPS